MATTSRFSAMPNINIGRTAWHMTHDTPTSWQHGRCIPLDCVPVLPGDTFKLKLSSLIRMSQPMLPIMDNIRCNIYSFFVPMRLVWEHTKEFFGENTTSAGPQLTTFRIPAMAYGTSSKKSAVVGSISHYLGKPYIFPTNYYTGGGDEPYISTLKERVYYKIWNEWFRAEGFQDPINVSVSDIGDIASGSFTLYDGTTLSVGAWDSPVLPCNKQFDYFTSCTELPQYGPAVEVPLGDYAPLGLLEDSDDIPTGYTPDIFTPGYGWYDASGAASLIFGKKNVTGNLGTDASNSDHEPYLSVKSDSVVRDDIYDQDFRTNLVVNLTNATSSSINTLRSAFAAQRFLERSNFGSRYQEYLKAHFGVNPPVGLLQVTELIGEHHFNINIQQVLSTAGATDDDETKLGQPGANSTTGDSAIIFKKGIVEHGFIMTIMTCTHDRHYTQGFLREDMKREELEIYHPEFALLGDQATKKLEIYAGAGTGNDEVFGFQEHWAEYRYRPSRATGLLDPNVPSSLSIWTLTDKYTSEPDLGNKFLQESREALANALVTGATGPDYIGDFYFDYEVVRPMPLFSMPGRIDHVGGW